MSGSDQPPTAAALRLEAAIYERFPCLSQSHKGEVARLIDDTLQLSRLPMAWRRSGGRWYQDAPIIPGDELFVIQRENPAVELVHPCVVERIENAGVVQVHIRIDDDTWHTEDASQLYLIEADAKYRVRRNRQKRAGRSCE